MNIFKPNSQFSEEEKLIIKLLILGKTTDEIEKFFPDYSKVLFFILTKLHNKLVTNSYRELEIRVLMYKKFWEKGINVDNEYALTEARKQRFGIIADLFQELAIKNYTSKTYLDEILLKISQSLKQLESILETEFYLYKKTESRISILVDTGTATPKEICKLLSEISKLYSLFGGSGLTFKVDGVKSFQEELV